MRSPWKGGCMSRRSRRCRAPSSTRSELDPRIGSRNALASPGAQLRLVAGEDVADGVGVREEDERRPPRALGRARDHRKADREALPVVARALLHEGDRPADPVGHLEDARERGTRGECGHGYLVRVIGTSRQPYAIGVPGAFACGVGRAAASGRVVGRASCRADYAFCHSHRAARAVTALHRRERNRGGRRRKRRSIPQGRPRPWWHGPCSKQARGGGTDDVPGWNPAARSCPHAGCAHDVGRRPCGTRRLPPGAPRERRRRTRRRAFRASRRDARRRCARPPRPSPRRASSPRAARAAPTARRWESGRSSRAPPGRSCCPGRRRPRAQRWPERATRGVSTRRLPR